MSEPVKVTTKDIDRVWYDQTKSGMWIVRVRMKKNGQSGIIRFGEFLTRDDAKDFLVQLKKTVV